MPRSNNRGPQKIPVTFATSVLSKQPPGLVPTYNLSQVFALRNHGLVQVKLLSRFFQNAKMFRQFKMSRLKDVPVSNWREVWKIYPESRKYCKRFMPRGSFSRADEGGRDGSSSDGSSNKSFRPSSPAAGNRKRLKMKAKLGSMDSSDEDVVSDEESTLFINPSNDECDEEDVNLPMPVCRGIRRVCRNYGPDRKYKKFKNDKSEKERYAFRVKYRR